MRQKDQEGDLSVTALYTSQVWRWGRLPGADLFDLGAARWVFRVTNATLGIARLFRPEFGSLRHALLHRHTAIDALINRSGARRVLELACGLSQRGAALTTDPALQVTEVDLPGVVEMKRELLRRTSAGRAVLDRPNLRIVAQDVREADLDELAPAGPGLFVVAEGLFMYLQAAEQRRLCARVARVLGDRGGMFAFDLVPAPEEPPPGAVGKTLGRLMRRFTGGRAFERDGRTREDIKADVREAGFHEVDAIEPFRVAVEWGLPYPHRRTRQLLFVCGIHSSSGPDETLSFHPRDGVH